jgi:hypothetical protein
MCSRFAAIFCAELAQKRVKKKFNILISKIAKFTRNHFLQRRHLEETFGKQDWQHHRASTSFRSNSWTNLFILKKFLKSSEFTRKRAVDKKK